MSSLDTEPRLTLLSNPVSLFGFWRKVLTIFYQFSAFSESRLFLFPKKYENPIINFFHILFLILNSQKHKPTIADTSYSANGTHTNHPSIRSTSNGIVLPGKSLRKNF